MVHDPMPWPIAEDRPPIDQHLRRCDCDECRAYDAGDPDLVAEWSSTGGLAALGLAVGFITVWLIDFVTGGPGLGVMVGL